MSKSQYIICIILSLFLCSCNSEEEIIKEYVYSGFGTPISEYAVEVCYKGHLYRAEIAGGFQTYKFGVVRRVIPMLENSESTSVILKSCSDKSLKYRLYE